MRWIGVPIIQLLLMQWTPSPAVVIPSPPPYLNTWTAPPPPGPAAAQSPAWAPSGSASSSGKLSTRAPCVYTPAYLYCSYPHACVEWRLGCSSIAAYAHYSSHVAEMKLTLCAVLSSCAFKLLMACQS